MTAGQRIFIPPEQFSGESAEVCGSDHLHLSRVLRIRPGHRVVLLNNLGGAFEGTITTVEKSRTIVGIDGPSEPNPEPACHITVAQSLGKADKFEQVIQHGTEAGASSFLPVRAERCVAEMRKESDRAAAQMARWRQIAKSAAEQSGRTLIPSVLAPVKSVDLLGGAGSPNEAARFILHPGKDTVPLRQAIESFDQPPRHVTIAVGSEGGWSSSELAASHASGWRRVGIGRFILRTETAALVAISQIMFCLDV